MNYPLPITALQRIETPFYYYDTQLLRDTLQCLTTEAARTDNYIVHYAVKANANPAILRTIAAAGLGADCVSGGEIRVALQAGIPGHKIVFAGVGKKDWEIKLALEAEIACFNVESIEELDVIQSLATQLGRKARIAFRVNPNIDAHTHANITTGLSENKFGIAMDDLLRAVTYAQQLDHIEFQGLHFHIGSQTTEYTPFVELCARIQTLQAMLQAAGIHCPLINVGGGLGVDYDTPWTNPIPDFAGYFATFRQHLPLMPGQTLHFELGRSVVAQCGTLVSEVIYVKQGTNKRFLIVDAGFTDLIRPALYEAYHAITVLTSTLPMLTYDVVGPICESSDVFQKDVSLPACQRGDLIALHTAGAYGEVMASTYNSRTLIKGYTTEELPA